MRNKLKVTSYKLQVLGFIILLASCILHLASASHAEVIDRVVAVVNDSIITLSELNDAAAELRGIKDEERGKRRKIIETKSIALDQLIEKKLVEQAANKAGISVSEKEIDNAVEDVKRQNNISQEELLSALARSGLTFKSYREQLKEQIRQVKFINRQFRSNINIPDEDVEAYYKQNKDRFAGPVAHRIQIISFPFAVQDKAKDMEKKAQDVLLMAKRGDDFARLAREYSKGANAQDGGDVGYIKAGEMDAAIEKAAAGLKLGEVSDIIRTSTGFHIIRLIDRQKSEARSISEVEDNIRDIIFRKIIDERYSLWLEEKMKSAYVEVRL